MDLIIIQTTEERRYWRRESEREEGIKINWSLCRDNVYNRIIRIISVDTTTWLHSQPSLSFSCDATCGVRWLLVSDSSFQDYSALPQSNEERWKSIPLAESSLIQHLDWLQYGSCFLLRHLLGSDSISLVSLPLYNVALKEEFWEIFVCLNFLIDLLPIPGI